MATLCANDPGSAIPGRSAPGADRAYQWSALIAALFLMAVCGTMFISSMRGKSQDPLKSPELKALKERLLSHPKDEPLKEQIRGLDLEFRRRYFRQLFLNATGAWLLFGSAGLFLLICKRAVHSQQTLPMPKPGSTSAEEIARRSAWSRWAVAAVASFVAIAILPFAFRTTTHLPRDLRGLDQKLGANTGANPVNDFASSAEMRANWPRFLGPDGTGFASETNAPLTFDIRTGTGIAWKTAISTPGFNSPLVWRDRILISGGDAAAREILCYDAHTGALLWQRPVQMAGPTSARALEIPEHTGYAPSTMATDGRRVYAIFANGDLAAFSLDGGPVWAKNLGVPKNPHGHASSLATWESRLIVQLDQGESEQNLSKLYAIDGRTGRVLWQKNRPVPASWATPLVFQAAGKVQIVTLAVPWAIAYSAQDGVELWRVEGLNNEVTSSPGYAAGLVLAISPHEKLMAIRPDGHGDITPSHVVWSAEDNIPDVTSPASNGDLVFTLSTPGMLTCYDVKDGKKLWEQDLEMDCQASPTIVGDRLYVIGSKGVVVVIEAARTFRELARNDLDEKIFASPAFVRGKMFVRGIKHLFCIGSAEQWVKRD